MAIKVIEESDISGIELLEETVVFVETRERAAEGSGVQVWSRYVLPPFGSEYMALEPPTRIEYIVIVEDPDDIETQRRVTDACRAHVLKLLSHR